MRNVARVAFSIILAYCISEINFDYVITLCRGIKNSPQFMEDTIPVDAQSSSVWCHVANGTRMCTFRNLCYRPEEKLFLFTLTEHSILYGLTSKNDLKSIRVSSVINHNLFLMNIAIIKSRNKKNESSEFISEPLFLLWRFKWDNVMHVIHDDILPLYLTYHYICKDLNACVSKYTLGFLDEGEIGPYKELYSLFSKQEPLLLHRKKELVCFPKVHAGILSTSVWFQYGFGKPQGPLNSNVPAALLHGFRDFIFQRYAISFQSFKSNNTILLFNRKLNRRILNYDNFSSEVHHIVQQIHPSTQPYIVDLDLSTYNLSAALSIVSRSRIVVGMHGSAMILCIFLRPGSVVMELFPYAIQPECVSYIKAFSNIVGTGIVYRSWVNKHESLTITHPEAPPLLGGIYHLPIATQELIQSTKTVPAVECCHNPIYLYRMFQDTVVGSDFSPTFLEALLEQKMFSEETFKTAYVNYLFATWYFPAPVTKVTCALHKQELAASWSPPINVVRSFMYDVAVLTDNGNLVTKRTSANQLTIDILSHSVQSAQVWVKVLSPEGESVDVYASCVR